ncbi:hypothetical protein [Thalassospira sp.]|uniref:hypothetical protein n=1 Tax=Thalassospira sp. TaxID=1912094 RepID=UPI0032EE5B57
MAKITFCKIDGTESQIQCLYDMLNKRVHNISHSKNPSYEEHRDFVLNHPYRFWYIVVKDDLPIGTCYVMESNSVSAFLVDGEEEHLYGVIQFILSNHKPLEELKSLRPSHFYINVPTGNIDMKERLSKMGWLEVQTTFSLAEPYNISSE